MFSSIDSISSGRTKSHFTPNLTYSPASRKVLDECSQEIGSLMTQEWLLSQVGHDLQVNRWRNDAVDCESNE